MRKRTRPLPPISRVPWVRFMRGYLAYKVSPKILAIPPYQPSPRSQRHFYSTNYTSNYTSLLNDFPQKGTRWSIKVLKNMIGSHFSGQKEILYNYDMDTNARITAEYNALRSRIGPALAHESALISLAVLCDLAELIATHLCDDTRGAGVELIRTLNDNATRNRCGCGQVLGPVL